MRLALVLASALVAAGCNDASAPSPSPSVEAGIPFRIDGTLSFVISSLHAAGFNGQGGSEIYPRIGTRESFGLPAPSIEVVLTTGPVACSPADVTTSGTANGVPDQVVDLSDFSYYLTLWGTGDSIADVTTSGTANGVPDGAVDLSDFAYYLQLWSAGCP